VKFVVGVTGGIGSGKTTVARMFQALGAAVVDTDEIAHRLTAGPTPAVQAIVERFGIEYRAADGALDRARMRALVFSDPAARRELEAILHPLIRQDATQRVAAADAPYVVLLVPLLVEKGGYPDLTSRVLVVDCDEAIQVERTMRRSGLSEAQVRAIMAAQASRALRLLEADDVIVNNGALAELEAEVRVLHERYLALARDAAG
jgi:dephospho-CoA kinase